MAPRTPADIEAKVMEDFCNDMSYQAVADKYGIAKTTVQRIVSPSYRERHNKMVNKYYYRQKAKRLQSGLLG